MIKKTILFLTVVFLLNACNKKTAIDKEFDCSSSLKTANLKKVTDYKNNFQVKLPHHWKINYYFDDIQSSIYCADTTKQLTDTMILDMSFVQKPIHFNDDFILNLEIENLQESLVKRKDRKIMFHKKEAYYAIFQGKKKNFDFSLLNFYIKTNTDEFLQVKASIYGDSFTEERICNSVKIIKEIIFNYDN